MTLDLAHAGGLLPSAAGIDALGLAAMAFGVGSSLMRARGAILAFGALAGVLFALHYLRLGALTGAMLCTIAVGQNLAAARWPGAGSSPRMRAAFAASALCGLSLTLVTWGGWPSAFAAAGAAGATVARLQSDASRMRLCFLAATGCWCVHDLGVGAPCALACEILTFAGFAYALARDGTRHVRGDAPPAGLPA